MGLTRRASDVRSTHGLSPLRFTSERRSRSLTAALPIEAPKFPATNQASKLQRTPSVPDSPSVCLVSPTNTKLSSIGSSTARSVKRQPRSSSWTCEPTTRAAWTPRSALFFKVRRLLGNLAAKVGRALRVWIQMYHKNENSMLDHEVQLAVLCSTNQSMSLLLLLSE